MWVFTVFAIRAVIMTPTTRPLLRGPLCYYSLQVLYLLNLLWEFHELYVSLLLTRLMSRWHPCQLGMFLRLHQLTTTSAVRRCGSTSTHFDIMLQAYASHIYLMRGWGPVPDLAARWRLLEIAFLIEKHIFIIQSSWPGFEPGD